MTKQSLSLVLSLMLALANTTSVAGAIVGLQTSQILSNTAAEAYVPKGSQVITDPAVLEYLSRGQQLLKTGFLPGADKAFAEAAKLDAKAYSPRLGQADVALRQGKLVDAERHLRAAQAMAPDSAELAAAAGRLAAGLTRWSEAQKQFERAISLDPRFVTPMTDLGELHMSAGRPGEAAKAFRLAIAAAPEHPGAQFGLARALAAQNDAAGATVALETAARLAPESALPLMALGELQLQVGQADKAALTMDRALKVEPGNLQVRLARANVMAARGDVAGALSEYTQAFKAQQGSPGAGAEIQFRLGQLLESVKRPTEAQAAYTKAAELEPRFHLAHNNIAWLAVQRQQNLEGALKHVRRALELAPGNPAYEDTLGAVLAARGDVAGALQAYQRALKAAPGAPGVLYRMGLAYQSAGQKEEARKAFKAALASPMAFVEREDAAKRLAP